MNITSVLFFYLAIIIIIIMNKFFYIALIFVFILNCFSFNSNRTSADVPTFGGDDLYKYYVLDRIDGPDIPDHIRQFANENNCFGVIKSYYWSHKLFRNKGGLYVCDRNGKAQFIYDNEKKLRFAKWYEKHKFRKPIFEF